MPLGVVLQHCTLLAEIQPFSYYFACVSYVVHEPGSSGCVELEVLPTQEFAAVHGAIIFLFIHGCL